LPVQEHVIGLKGLPEPRFEGTASLVNPVGIRCRQQQNSVFAFVAAKNARAIPDVEAMGDRNQR